MNEVKDIFDLLYESLKLFEKIKYPEERLKWSYYTISTIKLGEEFVNRCSEIFKEAVEVIDNEVGKKRS